jgi:CheY-like chemotaxis protein
MVGSIDNKKFLLMIVPAMITRSAVFTLLLLTLSVTSGSHACGQIDGSQDSREKLFHEEPDTPARLVRSADAAARLSRTQLARGYLRTLLDRGLSQDALLRLRDDVGMELFLSLNANVDLEPMSGELLRQVNSASSAAKLPPDRARELVEQLGNDAEQAKLAAEQLLTIDAPVVPAVLTVSPDSEAGRTGRVLVRRNVRMFRLQLLNALESSAPEDQLWLLDLLRLTADPDLAPRLLRYEFAADSGAVRDAAEEAINWLWSGPDRPETSQAAVQWLTRRALRGLVESEDRFADNAFGNTLRMSVMWAEDAVRIDPHDERAGLVLLVCRSAGDGGAGGAPGDHDRTAALDLAVQVENSAAALALLESDAELLRRSMYLSGPAVRLHAAVRLLSLDRPVRGRSYAEAIVRSFAQGTTGQEAVVIDPREHTATLATFLLNGQGYQAARALTGQAGFEQAVRQLNCELILIHTNCLRWSLSQTIANFRADSRTAQTPIAVYGPARDEAAVRTLQNQYPGISFLPGPLSEINFADELRRNNVPGPLLTEAARSQLIQLAREVRAF